MIKIIGIKQHVNYINNLKENILDKENIVDKDGIIKFKTSN